MTKTKLEPLTNSLFYQHPDNVNRLWDSTDIDKTELICYHVARLNTLNLCNCNNGLNDDLKSNKLLLCEMLKGYGIHTVQFDDEPRGYPVKLINLPRPDLWYWKDFIGEFIIPFTEDLR